MELLVEYPDLVEIGYLPFSTDPGSHAVSRSGSL